MLNPIETLRSVRQRINPEGLMFSAAVTATSPAIIPSVGAGMTFIAHRLAQENDPDLTKIAAAGIIGLMNVASVVVETKALESHKYSASPISSSFYVLTDRPLLSSLFGHFVNYAQISVLNPINIFAVATKDTQLLIESEGAFSLALTSWFTSLNTLVLLDKTRPFIDSVKKIREAIQEKFRDRTEFKQ